MQSGTGLTKAEECTANDEVGGFDFVDGISFDNGNKFVLPSYNLTFDLPYKKNEL